MTIRDHIIELLAERPMTANELHAKVGGSLKSVRVELSLFKRKGWVKPAGKTAGAGKKRRVVWGLA